MTAALLVLGVLLTACAGLLWFTLGCLQDIPGTPHGDDQLRCRCQPPMLVTQYPDHMTWRCGQCGRRWRIYVDLHKPREHYRQWVPK